jgi:hypothetical protein
MPAASRLTFRCSGCCVEAEARARASTAALSRRTTTGSVDRACLRAERCVDRNHWRPAGVDGVEDLGVVAALQVDRSDPEIRVSDTSASPPRTITTAWQERRSGTLGALSVSPEAVAQVRRCDLSLPPTQREVASSAGVDLALRRWVQPASGIRIGVLPTRPTYATAWPLCDSAVRITGTARPVGGPEIAEATAADYPRVAPRLCAPR